MADQVLQFLLYGAAAEPIKNVEADCITTFLPSLTLAAVDSPALIGELMPALYSQPQVPRALAYANLDYVDIAQSVLEAEAARVVKNQGCLPIQHCEDVKTNEKGLWNFDDVKEDADDCDCFEIADERERAKLAVISIRKRAIEYSSDKKIEREDTEGNVWSNDIYLTELFCLLPIAVSRCPTLLSAEQLVKGLVPTRNGCALLVATFANNPALAYKGVVALVELLGDCKFQTGKLQGSSLGAESAAGQSQKSGPGNVPPLRHGAIHGQDQAAGSYSPSSEAVSQVLLSLSKVGEIFATTVRDTLVKACTLPEVVLRVTHDVISDELELLSKLVFKSETTSQWITSAFSPIQKQGEAFSSMNPAHQSHSLHGKEKDGGFTSKHCLPHRNKSIGQRVRDALLSDAKSAWNKDGWGGRLHAHLRLYCVLVRAGDLQPFHEEVEFWLGVLGGPTETAVRNVSSSGHSSHPDRCASISERTLELGLCFLCLIPGLSASSTKLMLQKSVDNLLRAAIRGAPHSNCTPEIELAVWIAVQLLQRRCMEIASFVREVLGVQVTVPNVPLRDLADAADAAGVISHPYSVAGAVASLRPRRLISQSKNRLTYSFKCIEQLLQSTTFARCAVDISDAVMHYICLACEPVHAAFLPIIQSYTDLSAPRPRVGLQRFRMRPLSRNSIVDALAPGLAVLRSMTFTPKVSPVGSCRSGRITNEAEVSTCGPHGASLATTALVSYYILCRELLARSMGFTGAYDPDAGQDYTWWVDLLAGLPLRELLMYMKVNWPAYENLLPQWLGVASIVCPERLTARALLCDLESADTACVTQVENLPEIEDLVWADPFSSSSARFQESAKGICESTVLQPKEETQQPSPMDVDGHRIKDNSGISVQSGEIRESVSNGRKHHGGLMGFSEENIVTTMKTALSQPLPALKILRAFGRRKHPGCKQESREEKEKLAGIGVEWPLEVAMMNELVPQLLQSSCQRCLQDEFCCWWRTLPSSALERLVPVLLTSLDVPLASQGKVNAFRGKQYLNCSETGNMRLSTCGIIQEPLKLVACNPKVYRSPLLGIVLDLLLEILIANRRICQVAASDGGRDGVKRDGVKREEVAAAIIAQYSAVCQVLLVNCLPNEELGDTENRGPLLEARSLVLSAICCLIHRSPLLLKLLHFQCYDRRLLPVMVEGVPAMVQCLEFVVELIQQPQQERQIFGVDLTAHLIGLHPTLPQSLSVAQQVVHHVTEARNKVAGSAKFLQEVLGPVAQIAVTFPSLATQVVALLQSCALAGGPLTRSGPPRDYGLHQAAVSAFKHLIQSKLLHGRPPLLDSTWNPPEAEVM